MCEARKGKNGADWISLGVLDTAQYGWHIIVEVTFHLCGSCIREKGLHVLVKVLVSMTV